MAAVAPASNQRWLYGPVPDVLFGCGVAYMLVFAALCLDGAQIRTWLPLGLLPIVSVLFGTPHYGATLLRVYEKSSERRAYAFFTVYLTAVVWAFFVGGLYSAALGSLLLSIYLTWSPWHYTGQNYGVALLFLRRRGIEVTPGAKRLIHASFVLSYFLTFLAIHGASYTADYAPVDYDGSIFRFMRIGIPAPAWGYAFGVLAAAYVTVSVLAARQLLARAARAADLVPTALVAGTQLLWFSLPPLGRELGLLRGLDPFQPDLAAFVFIWVAAGHAMQYLWVTSYYAGERSRGRRWRYYAKCVCAGSAIWSLPAIAFVAWRGVAGPGLGGVATGEDVGVLLAAIVNIHHFMLDGAIWKLRDGRVARALIRRDVAGAMAEPIGVPRRRWLAPALLAAGGVWTFTTVASLVERDRFMAPALARGDFAAAEASLTRLSWMRRDGLADYHRLAQRTFQAGDTERSLRALEWAIERHGDPESFRTKATLLEQRRDVAGAAAAYEAGLRRVPGDGQMLYGLGRLRLEQGQAAEARALLERARSASPGDKRIEMTLERARAARPDEAADLGS